VRKKGVQTKDKKTNNTKWSQQEQGLVDANDLMRRKGIDQINLYELIHYIQESKLAFKIESYASHVEESNRAQTHSRPTFTATASASTSSPVLHSLVSFLVALTNLSTEGRIFYQKISGSDQSHASQPDVQLSYLLLSPTHAFSSVASAARAVVLAGGTMSPFDDYKDHLFPGLPPEKVTTLSCGHVIPSDNLRVWTLASARPDAPVFEFSYQRRGDRGMIAQLGLVLLNVCGIVPDGVVVFFPSYGYLDEVVNVWQQQQQQKGSNSQGNNGRPTDAAKQPSIWERLQGRKMLFRETRGGASEQMLQEYSQAVLAEGSKGALLLSVVGGKMSEGINFSDRLGRCVMVIGLPYPNMASPEWKAKMEYIETTTTARLLASSNSSAAPSASTSMGGAVSSATSGAEPGEPHHEQPHQPHQPQRPQSHPTGQNTLLLPSSTSIRNTSIEEPAPHESATSAAQDPNSTSTTCTSPSASLPLPLPRPSITREAALARGKQAARDFYENACMRAVNQSIGRAIRHRGDYAAIVLVDRRYGTERIRGKLPGWIRGGLVADSHEKGLGPLMGTLGGFFRGKKGC
jgi:Rad3-related DNA helicase